MDLLQANAFSYIGAFGMPQPIEVPRPQPRPPEEGEKTFRQDGVAGFAGSLPGFSKTPAPTFATFREMMCDPTIALTWGIITGPIYAGAWTVEAANDAPAEAVEFIAEQFDRLRPYLLGEILRAVYYGCQPFEKVWTTDDRGRWTYDKLKPLLPDLTRVRVTERGEFAGLQQPKIDPLGPEKCFLATWNKEADNWLGRSRLCNCLKAWHRWNELDDRGGQLATKVSSIIAQIHYPIGNSIDETGATISNYKVAMRIAQHLAMGNTVALPNIYARTDDPREAAELAGKSAWVISFLEAAGAAASMTGLTERQRYYDTLKVRGMLRPERAVIEATTAGSRADSETASDFSVLDSEGIDAILARQISKYLVNPLLAVNWGEKARGKVWIKPKPLADAKRAVFDKILQAVLTNPSLVEELVVQTDMDAVLDAMEIPKRDGKDFDFGATLPPPPEGQQVDPLADAQMQDLYGSANAGKETPDPAEAAPPAQVGPDGKPAAGVVTDQTLNGAQIQAAVEVITQLRARAIGPISAVELLVSVGIPRDRAQAMVDETKAAPPLPAADDSQPTPDEDDDEPPAG